MTERGMWQLKLDNFSPYLLPETETGATVEQATLRPEENIRVDVVTDNIEKVREVEVDCIEGFHNKEYFNICLKNLQGKEYSLGYKLHVTELAPYNEKEATKEEDVKEAGQ